MHLDLVLQMAGSGYGDRTALTFGETDLSYRDLCDLAQSAGDHLRRRQATAVLYLGDNHAAFPVALFGAARAGIPLIPLNYRLGTPQLSAQISAHPGAVVIHHGPPPPGATPGRSFERTGWMVSLSAVPGSPGSPGGPGGPGGAAGVDSPGGAAGTGRTTDGGTTEPPPPDPDRPCVLLYTSGTTSEPKASILRHRHVVSYLFGSCEFGSAGGDEAALVCVPPYHVAGVANLLSNIYSGRRIVYLERFDPELWLTTVRQQGITHAMVVPTMLARLVDYLDGLGATGTALPGSGALPGSSDLRTLRNLAYGGGRMPEPVLRRALEHFREVGFVNAYGLTETSSTIALLGPDDHRAALASNDPAVRARLSSVGRPLPGIEVEIRDPEGRPCGPGQQGMIFLRGPQVSGEYAGGSAGAGTRTGDGVPDGGGWFATRDLGRLDEEGYLFVDGRADDTIIRGGENISPVEIEDVLLSLDGVGDAVVVGVPDDEWGQRLVAVVVPANQVSSLETSALQDQVRERLRSSKTPDEILVWDELPRTDTGKIVRRVVVERLPKRP